MERIKHSKYKNAGILYELLTRQITVDLLNESADSHAIDIIKKYYGKKTELAKEYALYNALMKEKFSKESSAERFLEQVIKSRSKLDERKLAREKYELVSDIKERYPIDEFFQSRINNYREFASIYKMFKATSEGEERYSPADYVRCRYTLIEHITHKPVENKVERMESDVINNYRQESKDLRVLAQKIMTEKFNKRYGSLLDEQKELLKRYINNISNTNSLREYVDNEVDGLAKRLAELKEHIDDQVIRIKVEETLKMMEDLKQGNLVSDEQVTSLLMYYQLVEEINSTLREDDGSEHLEDVVEENSNKRQAKSIVDKMKRKYPDVDFNIKRGDAIYVNGKLAASLTADIYDNVVQKVEMEVEQQKK